MSITNTKINNMNNTASKGIIAFALLAGTGGISDINYLHNRQEYGYKLPIYEVASVVSKPNIYASTENLKHIRQILKPAISELALLFGVSRQAIYNWQHGEAPSIKNAECISELAKVADFLATEGLDLSSHIFKRKFFENKSLFDIAREGGSLLEAAQKLVNILRIEATQRKFLDERFAKRTAKLQNYNDYGTQMLDE